MQHKKNSSHIIEAPVKMHQDCFQYTNPGWSALLCCQLRLLRDTTNMCLPKKCCPAALSLSCHNIKEFCRGMLSGQRVSCTMSSRQSLAYLAARVAPLHRLILTSTHCQPELRAPSLYRPVRDDREAVDSAVTWLSLLRDPAVHPAVHKGLVKGSA